MLPEDVDLRFKNHSENSVEDIQAKLFSKILPLMEK